MPSRRPHVLYAIVDTVRGGDRPAHARSKALGPRRELSDASSSSRDGVAHRFGEARGRERVAGVVGLVERDERPKRTRHGRIVVPERSARCTATGMIGACVIACISGSGGAPAPVRNQVGASGTATRWPARNARREVACAVGDRAEAARRPPSERQPAARR